MGHFMGQKSQIGQKFVPKFIRENNTARKIRHFWAKKWSVKNFCPMLKPLRHKGFRVFWAKRPLFNLIYLRN
nr:MAG TPA: Bombesin-like peptide [Caudoviricetes sp.]